MAFEQQQISIGSDERCYITGMTGSGKSFLSRHILRTLTRLVALDPKGSLGKWRLEAWNNDTRRALADGKDVRVRVPLNPARDVDQWDETLWAAYNAGNCTVYVDELYLIISESGRGSSILRAIWTQGRERGIGAFAISQRPSWIPKYVISEAEHKFMFHLEIEDDRKYMAQFMGKQVIEPIPVEDHHGFWYKHIRSRQPIYVERLPVEHGEGLGEFEVSVSE